MNIKKKITFTFCFLLSMAQCWAIPAKPKPFILTLSDGRQITATLVGDESYHYLASFEDGTPIVQNADGTYRLAPEEKANIRNAWAERLAIRNQARYDRKALSHGVSRKAFGKPTHFEGKKKGLVILVNFKDKKINEKHTREVFLKQFNEVGYNEYNNLGSVHDYFHASSYGKFDLSFDVVGPVELNRSYTYYGENLPSGDDKHVATMVIEACRYADNFYDINWGDYDWDGDSYVDQVFFVYAGYGEHAGAPANTIWPQEFELSSAKEIIGDGEGTIEFTNEKDTFRIESYAVSCELNGKTGTQLDYIATPCHEFSHCLGIPDFYDTSYSGGTGMDNWDLMDHGSDSGENGGNAPCGFSAYERWFAGWLDFTELNEPTTITDMPCIGDTAVAYIIYNDNNRNEYFILENRQNKGWFEYVSSYNDIHGMLVTHVDYDEDAWINNEPNILSAHQRMSFIPAGGDYGTYYSGYGYYPTYQQLRSQLFPGSKKVTALTNTSHTDCGGKLFNQNTDGTYNMNKPVTDITESEDGLISFKFMGGMATGIQTTEQANEPEAPTFYSLNGMKIASPSQPGMYIRKEGNKTTKLLIK